MQASGSPYYTADPEMGKIPVAKEVANVPGGVAPASGYTAGIDPQSVRKGFLHKVYAILSFQLLITMGICLITMRVESVRQYVLTTPALIYTGFALSIVLLIALFCFARKHPINLILLTAWTIVEGYTIGVVCAAYAEQGQSDMVIQAFGITFSAFFVLSVFTLQSRWDFSFMGAGLGVALWILIIWGIINGARGTAGSTGYALMGAIIFSLYIVFDTWLISQKFGPDDYIIASVMLYLDLINLFMYVLLLLGKRD